MKTTIALSLLILSACNTGNVQVGSGTNASQPGTTGTTQGSTDGGSTPQQPGSSSNKNGSTEKVFFERITVRNAIPQLLIAISFNSENAKGASPFGITLLGNQTFSETAPFNPSSSDVTYLRSVDVGTDALLTTSLTSLDANQIFSFPRHVVDFSINADQSTVAWVDQAGIVSVSNIPSGQNEELDTTQLNSTTVIDHVQWNKDDSYLLARADNGSSLLFKTGTAKPTLYSGVNASSFSEDGTQLAYFNSTTKVLHIVDLATLKDHVGATFESSEIHDLSWNSPTSVSYWTVLASGAKELRVFTSGGSEVTIAALTLPASIKDGVVCPAWVGSRVYFGNYDSGKYVIEQSSFMKDAKKVGAGTQVFAETPDADLGEGFVCPKVVK